MKAKIVFVALTSVCLLVSHSCCTTKFNDSDSNRSPYDVECNGIFVYLTKCAIGGRDSESWKDPLGFQAGADFPVGFINPLTVKAGALVSFQGAGWQEGDLVGRVNLWYVYVPISLKYQHSSGFYGQVGLQPGLLFRARDKYEEINEDFMDQMNKFDLSVPLAVGYNFKNNFGVNLRIVPGINDITKDEAKDHNIVMGLGVTYTFNPKSLGVK